MNHATQYKTQRVGEINVFYREAGPIDAPVVMLLHGFPSSSHQYRNLIPQLAGDFRVIAPDLPGFGSTDAPARGEFDYTFDNLANTIIQFSKAIELDQFALYIFDYGAPVGLRLASTHPEIVTAIISQNGNVYEEGLTDAWGPIRAYWENASEENRNDLRQLLTVETTRFQYTHGVPDDRLLLVSPDAIAHDQAILDRHGSDEIQLDLFEDYKTNVASYPEWQRYLRTHQPPVLAIWGKNDPFFGPAGAEAYKRDVPSSQVVLLDAGHFPLETHCAEIAQHIRTFLGGIVG